MRLLRDRREEAMVGSSALWRGRGLCPTHRQSHAHNPHHSSMLTKMRGLRSQQDWHWHAASVPDMNMKMGTRATLTTLHHQQTPLAHTWQFTSLALALGVAAAASQSPAPPPPGRSAKVCWLRQAQCGRRALEFSQHSTPHQCLQLANTTSSMHMLRQQQHCRFVMCRLKSSPQRSLHNDVLFE